MRLQPFALLQTAPAKPADLTADTPVRALPAVVRDSGAARRRRTLSQSIKGQPFGWPARVSRTVGRGSHPKDRSVIGIGGSLAAPPLPHHRAYGSVHGGSTELSGMACGDGCEADSGEEGIGQRDAECRAAADPPWTVGAARGLGRKPLADAATAQRREASTPTLPVRPGDGA